MGEQLTPQEKVRDRVRKLLRLAASSDMQDAAAAAAAAQRLITRHAIDEASLMEEGIDGPPLIGLLVVDAGVSRMPLWVYTLYRGIAGANGCRTYYAQYDGSARNAEVHIGGPEGARQTVAYLAELLRREVDRLARRHARGRGRVYAASYRAGAVDRIVERVKAEAKKARREMLVEARVRHARAAGDRDAQALMPNPRAVERRLLATDEAVDKWWDEVVREQKISTTTKTPTTSYEAYYRGQRDGNTVDVGGSRRPALGDGD